MCPLSTPTHSSFDWNLAPFLVKKQIIDELTPRSVGILSSVSRECYYLTEKYRHLHIIDSCSFNLQIFNNGSFKATIFEGCDIDDERDKAEGIFDRNAVTHLALHFDANPETIIFEEKRQDLIDFLRHVHAIGTIEIDIQCDEASKDAKATLETIWNEFGRGLESAQKVGISWLSNNFAKRFFSKKFKFALLQFLQEFN